jgi:hypothetical protein
MHVALSFLFPGMLALASDRWLADVMSWHAIRFGELFPHLRWSRATPPSPRESFENLLFYIRWRGAVMCLLGIGLDFGFLMGR